jgi:hypothetical protein
VVVFLNCSFFRLLLLSFGDEWSFWFLVLYQSFLFSVPQDVRVLVPGAGLGRLAFEIARRGYTCQGNEFSLFMLFTSNFVLNKWVCWFAHRNV